MLKIRKTLSVAAGLALLAAGASTSRAAFTLSTDPYSIPAFTGTEPFFSTGTTGTLSASVEYAVFAPGTFPGPAVGGNLIGADPSAGADYVYAYKVDNLAGSTLSINELSVGWATGAILRNVGNNLTLGGAAPVLQYLPANSFINLLPSIAPTASSDVLYFTSPEAPTFASSTVGNGGLNLQELLPSPSVPEPVTGFSLVLGAGLATLSRRRARS